MRYSILVVICTALFLVNCSKDNSDELIQSYLTENGLTAQVTDEGLHYIIEKEGTGIRPTSSSEVTVHYEGTLLNGDVFDSSFDRGQTATFFLTQVIRAWQIGIPLIKEGGKIKLICPPDLAYGSNPPPGSIIGNNEVLVFEVELFNVR